MNYRQQFKQEGPTGGHLIQASESASRSNQVAQGFKSSRLKNLQGWHLHSLYGQPAPALDCSQSSYFLLSHIFLLLQLTLTVPHSPIKPHWEVGVSAFLIIPCWVLTGCCWASPEAIPPQGWIRSDSSPRRAIQILLDLFSCFMSFLYWQKY